MSLRVLLDAGFAARAPRSGTAVYTDHLLGELERRPDLSVRAVADHRRPAPAGGGLGSVRNLAADLIWGSVTLPRLARTGGFDVVHHTLPAPALPGSQAQVITVHDLAFERLPACFDPRYRRFAHLVHRAGARRADVVICVSQSTAQDAESLWGVDPQRIVVAHHGPGQHGAPLKPRSRTHFLYVGDDEPRKDLGTLLSAYALYRRRTPRPVALVLAGAAAHRAGAGNGAETGLRPDPDPSAARLAELYAGAVALIHPSRYEGFGLSALEAMAAGAPVIAARCPALTEVCGDAALLLAPGHVEAMAAAMERLATQPDTARKLAERGLARAAAFSWAACARTHAGAYSLAVEMAARRQRDQR